MSKQVQDAYIVAATRSAVGKAPRGMFKNVRPSGRRSVKKLKCLSSSLELLSHDSPSLLQTSVQGCPVVVW